MGEELRGFFKSVYFADLTPDSDSARKIRTGLWDAFGSCAMIWPSYGLFKILFCKTIGGTKGFFTKKNFFSFFLDFSLDYESACKKILAF